ncbi:MAG: UvrD-helicase domain-containing protein [Chloroflexi bacterium]|nr:UvrD-helicase domain-containing protein [Chloroflexota bacterium]MCI0784374.1 UvrD-helicase domain-containing protein [Chloroflexota bacterium]MCI0813925.1 UvrD-helicase domain-containing protein [Chloroflexota bacterium]MCI0816665.1 UvrD-helicase domain-containing protein [Chloroflexota bacterium]MCI0832216.1 UvrD-helicase domain-containing protein [Chloroflexota bacterium]
MSAPTKKSILANLNPRQREAVETTEGALLILAGPGSGKTRVIAHRIAYLVREKRVHPRRILAVTFTNKAAREMRDRVHALVGEEAGRDITLGTFHGVCARILRVDGEAVGVERSFTIYDSTDQIAAVKRALDDMGLDSKRVAPRAVLSAISRAKSELQGPRQFAALVADYFQEVTSRVYLRYQELLEESNALDFDDILLKVVELYQERQDVLEKYGERWGYVHIDEFQDTNIAQYILAKQWASVHGNICVVGDPDQSIYTWRAADIRNILNFENDFPDAKLVILDQNYRSTQTILDTAHSVIARNKQRKEKNLWTENAAGQPVVVHEAYDHEDEATFVTDEIQRLVREDEAAYRDIAVMYRTNAQSRPMEEALVRRSVPYRLIGGTRFYERREVKDLLAYLRLIQNPFDAVAMMRVINKPSRGIGDRTLAELARWSREKQIPPYSALQIVAETERDSPDVADGPTSAHPFRKRTAGALLRFLGLVNELIELSKTESLSALVDTLIDRTDYKPYIMAEEDGEDRWENVQELRAVLLQYDELKSEHALASFLEDVALITDVDEMDASDSVTLITLHAAKGLEFPIVFITGLEEGILPHMRSLESGNPEQLEEERRLCYVGMTRAKQQLYLVRAFRRAFGGHNPPSRFLADIPPELVRQSERAAQSEMFTPRRYRHVARDDAESPAVPADSLAAGDRVRHPKFGEGIVVSSEPSGADYQVVIAFQGEAGIKKLLLSFAPLEKIEA